MKSGTPTITLTDNAFILQCRVRKALFSAGLGKVFREFEVRIDREAILRTPTDRLPSNVYANTLEVAKQYVGIREPARIE